MHTNPTDLGWWEPWGLWVVSAAPWNGGPAEVGRLVWKAGEQLLEALGPRHPLVPRLPQPSLINCHRNPKLWAWPLKDQCFLPPHPPTPGSTQRSCRLPPSPPKSGSAPCLVKSLSPGDQIRFSKSFVSSKKVMSAVSALPPSLTLADLTASIDTACSPFSTCGSLIYSSISPSVIHVSIQPPPIHPPATECAS